MSLRSQIVPPVFPARRGGLIGRNAIIHTDQGSQYAAVEYRRLLFVGGFRQSMSRKGNCCGQRPGGRVSFPGSRRNWLKTECLNQSSKPARKSSVTSKAITIESDFIPA
jgi:transposase InsO family protein